MPGGEGNCYEDAMTLMLELDPAIRPAARVCHGTALGTGGEALGLRYGHAWLEIGEVVVDNSGLRLHMGLRERYYAAGSIEADKVMRYTFAEMAEKVLETGHSGPWHATDAVHRNADEWCAGTDDRCPEPEPHAPHRWETT